MTSEYYVMKYRGGTIRYLFSKVNYVIALWDTTKVDEVKPSLIRNVHMMTESMCDKNVVYGIYCNDDGKIGIMDMSHSCEEPYVNWMFAGFLILDTKEEDKFFDIMTKLAKHGKDADTFFNNAKEEFDPIDNYYKGKYSNLIEGCMVIKASVITIMYNSEAPNPVVFKHIEDDDE